MLVFFGSLKDAEIVNVAFLVVGDAVLGVSSAVWQGHTNATQRRNAPASAVQKWDICSFRIPKYSTKSLQDHVTIGRSRCIVEHASELVADCGLHRPLGFAALLAGG